MPWLLTFDLAGEMDLFFVRKLSLRKLECINQIGNEGGMECKEKHINLSLSCDPYPNRELILCFHALPCPHTELQGTGHVF